MTTSLSHGTLLIGWCAARRKTDSLLFQCSLISDMPDIKHHYFKSNTLRHMTLATICLELPKIPPKHDKFPTNNIIYSQLVKMFPKIC